MVKRAGSLKAQLSKSEDVIQEIERQILMLEKGVDPGQDLLNSNGTVIYVDTLFSTRWSESLVDR